MVSLMADESRVVPMLESLDGERLEQTIERLEDFEGEFPEQAAVVVVPVLINKNGFLERRMVRAPQFFTSFQGNPSNLQTLKESTE